MERYNPQQVEAKWQSKWERERLYAVSEESSRPKLYELTMFPYTSGDLHIGHWYALVPADAHARFMRMKGYNVLHPIGFDAFGLPAENAAIKHGIHPHIWTMKNVENMRRQLRSIGAIYDWDREVITCLPEYYKWTQWFFLQLYKAGLAYRAKAPANWCPNCQTVLANEQVTSEGKCERCDAPVTRKDLEQWFLHVTRYADELVEHEGLDWPERVKTMQRNWVGRSEGAEISFNISEYGLVEKEIRVFTTRPDTIYGVTFMVLAPEHPLVEKLTFPEHRKEVESYVDRACYRSEVERLSTERKPSGAFIGAYAINPLNGERIPIFIADYVFLTYGTGAVMGVPAHDERDFQFAKLMKLPIKLVIAPQGGEGEELEEAYEGSGIMVNSAGFNGISNEEGKEAIIRFLEEKGCGKRAVSYRLRDWLISRQRYWGAPIPIIYCPQCGEVPVPEKHLPVLLPEDAEFKPTGESPLKRCDSFVNTVCPLCGALAKRETDTMDTFMCSNWYFLRYVSPKYDKGPFNPQKADYWLPIDLYTGGVEHATMHLLYARFFIKALRDIGLVNFSEPFIKLFNQGTIILNRQKMSKSHGNIITPDEYVIEYGSDIVRAYLMFVGPWEEGGEWEDNGLVGIWRWLNRIWKLVLSEEKGTSPIDEKELRYMTHKIIKEVTQDLERFHFNTSIARLMEFSNYLVKVEENCTVKESSLCQEAIDALLLMLAPLVPHLAEELWERTGHPYSVHNQFFPTWQEEFVAREEFTLVVQVNGKVRHKVTLPFSISEEEVKQAALNEEKVKTCLKGQDIKKIIYVPGRLVNIVTK